VTTALRPTLRPLPRAFFARPTLEVAPTLLGALLVRRLDRNVQLVGRLVEVEAYLGPLDPASHAYRRTPRSAIMWGPPGIAYVYVSYGNHYCMNVVTEPEGTAGAVLLRALEPIEGIEEMRRLRGVQELKLLTSGPGRLTQAFAVDLSFNGADLTREGPLYLAEGTPPSRIASTPRIGIRRAADRPWRFIDPDSSYLSRSV